MDHHEHHQQDMADRGEHLEGAAHGAGHDRHAGHSVAAFRDKFWLTLALTIPVVLLSHDIQEWFGYSVPMFPAYQYAAAILGTVIFLYGGMVFIRGAQGELTDRKPGVPSTRWPSCCPTPPSG